VSPSGLDSQVEGRKAFAHRTSLDICNGASLIITSGNFIVGKIAGHVHRGERAKRLSGPIADTETERRSESRLNKVSPAITLRNHRLCSFSRRF
jgi:hypothetical protein